MAGEEKATEAEEASGSQEPLAPEQKPEKMEVVELNEATISTKTSMESLEDQLNDNNSNNYCTRVNGLCAVPQTYSDYSESDMVNFIAFKNIDLERMDNRIAYSIKH